MGYNSLNSSLKSLFSSVESDTHKIALISLIFLSSSIILLGQADGDYQSRASGNWDANTTWQIRNGGAWINCNPGDYPGVSAGAGTVTIINNTIVNFNVSPVNSIGAVVISTGANNTGIAFSGSYSLTVTGDITINGSGVNNIDKYINVGDGTLSVSSVSMTDGGANSRDCYLAVSAGVITVSGNIAMAGNNSRNYLLFNGSGTLNIAGSVTGGGITSTPGGGASAPASGLVNYNNAGSQNVGAYTYYNLTLSGSGTKSLTGLTTVVAAYTSSNAAITLACGGNNLTFNGDITNSGLLTTGANTVTYGGSGAQAVIAANYNNLATSGARTVNSLTFTGTIGIAGNFTPAATFTGGSNIVTGSTIDFNGDAAQNVPAFTYNNLNISNINSSSAVARTKSQTGVITVSGGLNIGGYDASITTFQLGNFNFTALGSTNINDYGRLADVSGNTNVFAGPVVISSNGRWDIPVTATFRSGLTANSVFFNATGAIYTFDTGNQTINGAQSITIPSIVVTGITLTNANTNGLTVSGTISGTGSFTNGTASNNAILYLSGSGNPLALTGTTDFTSSVNTVNFNANTVQTITASNYYNLTISGARAASSVTLANGGTIRISGVFSPVATFTSGNYISANNTIEFNGTAPQTIPSLGTAGYFNIIISGGSTKSLSGNVILGTAVAGTLTLNNGVVGLDGFNLTVLNETGGVFVPGTPFGPSNMISTEGTGFLQKNGSAAAGFQIIFPVGSGGYYSPLTISSIGTVTPAWMRVRAVPTAINPSYIKKYWDVTASTALNNVTATFQYDPAEANGASPSVSYSANGGTTWQNPPVSGTSSFGANSFTITGTNPFNGWWTMGYRTYYSYQTGDWSVPSTWTSDPSGTLQLGNTLPGVNDLVVILSGRTVSMASDVVSATIDLTISEGGYLNINNYNFTSGLQALRGQGTLQLASAGFPLAVINTFVNAGGGTTEYNAPISLPAAQTTYNNLKINTSGAVIQLHNLTLNGNLDVVQGSFQVNDNSSARRQLTINGNVTVSNGASVTVGTGVTNSTATPTGIATTTAAPFIDYYDSQSHRIVIMGDFINNGIVRFTNLAFPVYNAFPPVVNGATTGFATVYFRGATNNSLTCNGITDFYNIVLDKGTDQSFGLTVSSSDYSYFRIFGANIAGGDFTAPATASDPNIKKALWIRTGTLTLEGSVVIPSLSEGNDAAAAALNYIIPANGSLKLNGIDVIVQSTADLYEEVNAAYGVAGGTGTVNGVTGNPNESGLLVMGKLEINNGFLSAKESRGILYNSALAGQVFINGGTVDTKQFRSVTPGAGLVAFSQTGGTLSLRGRFQRSPSSYSSATDLSAAPISTIRLNDAALLSTAGSFSIENTSDVFTMTGGAINIYDVPAPGATSRAYDILTSSANFKVTGGTVSFLPSSGTGGTADATPWLVSSASPVGNMIISRASGSSDIQLNTGYPLTVLNNLSLQLGVLNANSQDVTIGGDFSISAGTTFTTGANTTTFNGTGAQAFTIDLAGALTLNNLKIDKTAGVALTAGGTQGTLNVAGTFSLFNGTFNDNGKSINIAGNVYNSGLHTGAGKLSLNGTNPQAIDGSGTGVFQNLELNNTNGAAAPVSLVSNTIINGTLTFSQDKLFNISNRNLQLNASASVAGAGSGRYIQTAGALGDGGLTKVFSSAATFIFPVGVINYTPGSIGISGTPTAWGTITVVPVNYAHPNVTAPGRSLSYFWRVKSSGLITGPATLTQGYTYNDVNVITGAGITEDGYVAARYNPATYTWTKGSVSDVDETNNITGEPGSGSFLENTAFIDGDYTAGDDNPTSPFGIPAIYYSRQSGTWGTAANWSLTSHTVTNPPASPPGASDIVIIGNGHTITFATPANYLTNANTDPHSCASLQVASGSTLDIRFNPASTFGMVQSHPGGNGTIRIAAAFASGSTFAFPAGDFSEFNQNLGTTELYSTNSASNTTYWLPNGIGSYGNLIISPLGGSNIIFPNNNLTVLGDLIMKGQNADSWFCPTWSGAYPTAPTGRVSKTITVFGDFDIQGGSLGWNGNGGGGSQDIVVNGDVIVAPGAGIDVWSSNASQSMKIGGSLINNSTNAIAPLGTRSYVNLTQVPVTFIGSANTLITNTAGTPRTDFGSVTVNKGTSQTATLTLNIGNILNTPANNWLTLQNGTFRYMRTDPPAGANFNISTTTQFNIPSTAGLYIDYANANNVNILIGNAANNNGDLLLGGKLTVMRGNVYIGPASAPNNHNDIEYSGSGASEIDLQGGVLIVNGNIRRAGTSGGILKYSQSGTSTLTINGRGSITANAKLEILNNGSRFNMSGTSTLTIVRGGGTGSYGDLYLRPENSSVTGGTIYLQPVTGITGAEEAFKIDASVPLNNLTITGFAAADAARVSVSVNPLVVKGNLVISNANSFLTTNNLDLIIGGNFTNSGTYTSGSNSTTFNGNSQSVLGSTITNFYNLIVSPVTSLNTTLNNYTVNNNLTVNSGILILNDKLLTVLGNIVNNGSYTDDNSGGGISMGPGSPIQQKLSGAGSFGRLLLNNPAGASLLSDISVQNNLVLTSGKLDINQYQLTLGLNCIIGGSPFSLNNMIVSDGVESSLGVRKFFPVISSTTDFVFPVGVSGKYTPANYTINSNGAVGYINVNPINSKHPAVLDPANVLKYYWQIESSGISGFDGSLVLKYMSGDVSGIESDYVATRLLVPGTYWSKATPGSATDNVDESLQQITFNMPSGTNNLSGDYTAGADDAISEEVPTYESNRDGDWSDETIWSPVGSSPTCPIGGPNGFIVTVDHIVNIDVNNSFAYKTTINNKLRIVSPTIGHNLGLVDGTGTLYLEGPNLPAGNFSSFLNCSTGGTLEYGGTGNYTIIASQYNSVPTLLFTGSGTRTLPNKDLTICNRLVIDGPILDNTANNKALIILGTIERYNSGAFRAGTGAGATVAFQGITPQTLGGTTGDFSGTNRFNNLEINNSSGLTLNGGNELSRNLLLTKGNITTTAANFLFIINNSAACVTPSGGSSLSFVNGPLRKNITNGTGFIFPVGTGNTFGHPFTLTNLSGGTFSWNVSYNIPNATASSYTAPLLAVNPEEYWKVSVSSGSRAAKVKLGWDTYSDLTPLMTLNGLADMRVAEYSAGTWNERLSVTTGNASLGDVETSGTVSITTTDKNYSIGSVSSTIPRASFAPAGPICGTAGIPVKFTSFTAIPLNYTLDYTIDGIIQPSLIVTSTPYTLPTPVPGVYVLTGFKYNNGAATGVVDITPAIAYSVPTAANAGPDQSLCGLSGASLAGNNPGTFTGLWTKVSGTGGTILLPGSYNSGFIGLAGNTYVLRWTISSGTCTSSDNVTIAFPVAPQRPSTFTSAPTSVCQGVSGYVYTVPNVPGTTYNWSYSGTGATITGSGNSVTVAYSGSALSGTLSVTATNGCGTSAARSVSITVNTTPSITATTPGSTCGTGSVSLGASSSAGIIYWYAAPTGGSSLGSGTTFTTPVISSTTTYYVHATLGSCTTLSRTAVIATVNTVPSAPAVGLITQPTCIDPNGTVILNNLPAGNWTINPGAIAGNTASTTIPGLVTGTYVYTVTNSAGCTSAASSNVVIDPQPTVPGAAGNISGAAIVCQGQTIVSYSVPVLANATGYTWAYSGTGAAISGTTNNITIDFAANATSGDLTVQGTNSCGNGIPSSTYSITVNSTPAITIQPANQTTCAGTSVSFSVTATGTGLTYQWRKGAVNIGGATSATYTIAAPVIGDAGSYDVVVTGTCAPAVTSTSATLTVNSAPAITTQPTNQTTCAGTSVSFSVTATGTGLTYQWRKGAVNIGGETSATYTIAAPVPGDAGSYDVVITGTCTPAVTSAAATLTVNSAPVITAQPTNQTTCAGTSVSFGVTATGTGLTYQWRKGAVNIGGATAATYTIAAPVIGDAGSYDVVITGTCAPAVTSAAATLTVNSAPAITVQPTNRITCAGTSVSFSVTATGTGLTYQWRKGAVNIGGATSATYTIAAPVIGDAGSYDVVITGTCTPAVTSTSATLTVNSAPAITAQPANRTTCAGTSVSFSVTATGMGLTYQWRRGAVNIGGATSATYTIAAPVIGDAGSYDVVVTGTCAPAVTSTSATLTVNSAPAITTQPTNQTTCAGTSVSFSVTATGTGLTYQWRKGAVNIGGATSATYTIAAPVIGDAGSYDVVVTGTCAPAVTSTSATLTVNSAPAITTQPTNQTTCAGTSVSFSVTVTGTGLTYQWRKGAVNIGGATSATYTIAAPVPGDAGSYDVVITGTCTPAVTSAAATLTVNSAPVITAQPTNQTTCAGTSVSFGVTATGTGLTYQWRKGAVNIGGATAATYTIAAPVIGDAGSYDVVITGTCAPAVTSAAATLTVNSAPAITVQPTNRITCAGTSVSFSVTATGTGLTYQWRKGAVNIGGATSATYTIAAPVIGDAGSYDVVITGTCTPAVTSTSATLTVNSAPAITAQPANRTTCAGTSVSFSVTATGMGLTYQWRRGAVNIGGATAATYTIAAPVIGDAGSYDVVITGTCTPAVTSAAATLTVNSAPAITVQPTNRITCAGTSVSFSVTATGTGLTYQWRKGAVNIGGATAATYTIAAPVSGDAGSYDVVITGTCAPAVTSAAATLTVNSAPAITVQPTNRITCAGTSVSFSVTATGTGLTYQWRKGAVNMGGATSATYTIAAPVPGDAGSYDVVITGTCTPAVTSTSATLTVNSAPAITAQPANRTTCAGTSVSFSVTATGTGLTYQWRKGAVNIGGATAATYTIAAPVAGDAGSYDVVITGTCAPAVTSAAGILTIDIPSAPIVGTITEPTCTVSTGSVVLSGLPSGNWTINPGAVSGSTVSTTLSGLPSGTYSFTVTNATGCISPLSASVIINAQPVTPVLSVNNPAAVCSPSTVNLTDAAITAGSPAGLIYTYWRDAAATLTYPTPAAAASGTYYIKGTNASGCYDIKPVIAIVSSLAAIVNSSTNVSCAGASTGSIDITVNGGTLPYAFAWTGSGVNAVSEDQAGLSAGIYTVTATDVMGCISPSLNITITEPSALSGSITSKTDVSVSGGSDGSVTVTGSGGTSPYRYRLGAGTFQVTGTFSNLTAGNYSITVQDFNLCSSDIAVTISEPASALTGSITAQTNVTCFGASTGSVTVTGAGGTSPYEYKTGTGPYQSSGTFSPLPAGNYTVTIRDGALKTFDVLVTITQPSSAPVGSVISQVNIPCNGGSTGSVVIAGSGGTSPYLYKFESGLYQGSGTFSDLSAGSFTITVRDANMCTSDILATITEPEILIISYSAVDASCKDVADGEVVLTPDGGTPPYAILWPDGSNSVSRKDLLTGTYRVISTDLNGCSASQDIEVGLSELSKCLSVQEIITPNNDGYYDKWKIKNIEMFPDAEVHVFNRWGEMVFTSKNIPENEWDGTYKGKLLPTDSYHYVLYLHNGSDPISGFVTIIR